MPYPSRHSLNVCGQMVANAGVFLFHDFVDSKWPVLGGWALNSFAYRDVSNGRRMGTRPSRQRPGRLPML